MSQPNSPSPVLSRSDGDPSSPVPPNNDSQSIDTIPATQTSPPAQPSPWDKVDRLRHFRAFAGNTGWGDAPSDQFHEAWEDLDSCRHLWQGHKKPWKATGALVHELNIAHYSRTNDFGWSWEGGEGRDESLDTLSNRTWSAVQLHRSLKEAAAAAIPPPTFTGPQVLERIAQVERAITANRCVLEDVHTQAALLEARVRSIKGRQVELAAEAEELRAIQSNLRDLYDLGTTWRTSSPPTTSD
ncbi:hypothetical protein V5O48_009065 [Marasmius crinis-equi]|uniref:Uncharacterized protein n=1 Tax=Marasmius crinis-equi TaxID=585013 RepID=A0ABR3FC81_9AGAR